jgi:PAS domain-containing protein
LLWLLDVTVEEQRAAAAGAEAEGRAQALEALPGLIRGGSVFRIWYRGPDPPMRLALRQPGPKSRAGRGGEAGAQVTRARALNLVDEADGRHAQEEAQGGARARRSAVPHFTATVAGERRMMQDLSSCRRPSGVAGFAIDVDDQEQARAELGRFQTAQRDLLDRLSAGVAQFGRDRSLLFFNQPFVGLFGLTGDFLADRPDFDRVIDAMRDARKLPEPRDYPSWKASGANGSPPACSARRRIGSCRTAGTCACLAQPLPGRRAARHLRGPHPADQAGIRP